MVGRPRSTRPPASAASPAHLAGSVQALERGLNLLALIAEADGLSLTSIAQRGGLSPSTAHRILNTLKVGGFIQYDDTRGYLIGVEAFRIGSAFLRNRKLVDAGRRPMRELMEMSKETVTLGIEIEGHVVFVAQMESHHAIRAFHRPGGRGPLHASSLGKAMLAAMADDTVGRLTGASLPRFTTKTLVDAGALRAELSTVRQRGWAIDDEEHAEGLRCVGAAIYNEHGEAIGAISVSGPTVRMTDARLEEFGPMVKRAALEVTARVGGNAR
jgi:IclR family transcriptional regulator, acetate operon repressor